MVVIHFGIIDIGVYLHQERQLEAAMGADWSWGVLRPYVRRLPSHFAWSILRPGYYGVLRFLEETQHYFFLSCHWKSNFDICGFIYLC